MATPENFSVSLAAVHAILSKQYYLLHLPTGEYVKNSHGENLIVFPDHKHLNEALTVLLIFSSEGNFPGNELHLYNKEILKHRPRLADLSVWELVSI